MPKMLELFAGTRSIGKAFDKAGWETYSVEWDKKFENITLYADISTLTADQVIEICGAAPDVIWASPDCSTYSVAGIGNHRRYELGRMIPTSEYAKFCDKTNAHLLELLKELNPKYFFIENPVGALRKMPFMVDFQKEGYARRYTVTYCQYGDTRMKPTDIWTNHPQPLFKRPCKYGDDCHEKAPRHSRNGTQALKNARDRAVIPPSLCEHIVNICSSEPKVRNTVLSEFIGVIV